jgi:hypothetical protein
MMSANDTSELDPQSRCVIAVGRGHMREPPICSTRLRLGHGPNAAQIGGDMHALFQACGEAGTPVTMVW